mgnify:CR=1 FL=1|tara:strand:- start:289 stop:807 length:519 start_codon:yes stop_codon:yes gene_type:complete
MTEIVFKEGGRNQHVFKSMWRFNQGFWFEDESPKNTTNLCQWVRVVIIWPFFHIAAFIASAYALYSAIAYCLRELADPVVNSNFWSYIVTTVIIIAIIVSIITAWAFIKTWAEDRKLQRRAGATWSPDSVDSDQVAEPETPWHKLIWAYLVALKQQVCPVIRYSRNVDGEVL